MKSAFITFLAAVAVSMPAFADDAAGSAAEAPVDRSALDAEVQSLRREVVDLNRDLFMLEEDLLFPASTQVAVFVSMDVGTFFALDSVQLKVDDKEVANYLYTEREQEALKRGGVQRLWLGNLKAGRARGHRVLHRPGAARARLQARHDAQGGEGRRREVPGAPDQRQGQQAPARVRGQGLGVTGACCAHSSSSRHSRRRPSPRRP